MGRKQSNEGTPALALRNCFVQLHKLELVDQYCLDEDEPPIRLLKCYVQLDRHEVDRHMMMSRHTGEKPYSCPRPGCGEKTFSTAKNAQIHEIAVHHNYQNRRSHKCDHCDKAFNFISQKMIHERRHREKAKAYRCKYCEKGFHRRINLVRHSRIHTHTGKKVKKLIRKQKQKPTILNKFGKRSTKHNNILARNRSRVLVRKRLG